MRNKITNSCSWCFFMRCDKMFLPDYGENQVGLLFREGDHKLTGKQIEKAAKKFLFGVRGNVDFVSSEAYINAFGYRVYFYNTAVGDREIERYSLGEKAARVKAFAFCGPAKLIFIDGNASAEDKLYLLLHEIGHIVLGHLDDGRLMARSGILCDIDANCFAHCVLNPVKKGGRRIAAVAACVLLISSWAWYASTIPGTPQKEVYITATGAKYHKNGCVHIRGTENAVIGKSEAQKLFEPCAVCNP